MDLFINHETLLADNDHETFRWKKYTGKMHQNAYMIVKWRDIRFLEGVTKIYLLIKFINLFTSIYASL